MAETKYTRTYATACPSELIYEMNNDATIGPDLLQIVDGVAPAGDLDFWFENALTAGEITAFDNFLSLFQCSGSDTVDGEASSFTAKNVSGSTLEIGDPVYSLGVDGAGIIQIVPADASNPLRMPAFGLVVTAAIDAGELGIVTLEGEVTGMDTSGFAVEDELYIAVGGGLTATKPTGKDNLIQKIAFVQEVDVLTGKIVVAGAGRTNDVPNIEEGHVWMGDVNDVPQPVQIETKLVDQATTTIAVGATSTVISFAPTLNAGTKYIVTVIDTVTGDVATSEVLGNYKLLGNVVTHNHYGKIGDNIKYRPILTFASPNVNLDVQNNDTNPIIVSVTRIPMLSA